LIDGDDENNDGARVLACFMHLSIVSCKESGSVLLPVVAASSPERFPHANNGRTTLFAAGVSAVETIAARSRSMGFTMVGT